MSKRSLIQKACLEVTDIENGGILLPELAKEFIVQTMHESVLMKMITVRTLRSHSLILPRLNWTAQSLKQVPFCTPLTDADCSKPDFDQVELNTKLYKACLCICDETLEDNIMGGRFKDFLVRMMAEKLAEEIDNLILNGDTTSADPFLSQMDGIVKLASDAGNVVTATTSLTPEVLRDMYKALGGNYARRKRELAYLTSFKAETDYRFNLGGRQTDHGDWHLGSTRTTASPTPVHFSGIPVYDIPAMREDLGTAPDFETQALLMRMKDFVFGFWRKIKIEMDRDIKSGQTIIVASMRMGSALTDDKGLVLANGIKV